MSSLCGGDCLDAGFCVLVVVVVVVLVSNAALNEIGDVVFVIMVDEADGLPDETIADDEMLCTGDAFG